MKENIVKIVSELCINKEKDSKEISGDSFLCPWYLITKIPLFYY